MPEIIPEYPEGQAQTEMLLVGMLRDKRSWNDYRSIVWALWNLRRKAKLMQEEKKNQNCGKAESNG